MKVIIAGSRNIRPRVNEIGNAVRASGFDVTEVVSGGASGVDHAGYEWAYQVGIDRTVMEANWNRHGAKAGPLRNQRMADYADALILIWNGQSRGSASMKREAEARGLPIHEVVVHP